MLDPLSPFRHFRLLEAVPANQLKSTTTITLERPASIRRQRSLLDDDHWILPEYVVGPENEALRFLFSSKTIRRLDDMSPIVFYGEAGTGKTALAITLAVRWSRLCKLRPLCFTTGESFGNDFVAALEIDDVESFRHKHRSAKLLVIDDLDSICTKPAAQEELKGTLDALGEKGSPVILTASRLPASTKQLKASLTSRLSAGFSIQLHKPSLPTRNRLLRLLAQKLDRKVQPKILEVVCDHAALRDLRAIDYKRITLLAQQNLSSEGSLDPQLVAQLATHHVHSQPPTLAAIARAVGRKLRVRLNELRGATRQSKVVRARGLAVVLARTLTASSLQQIGEYFGGRDHSTVLHAYRKTMELLEQDVELSIAMREIQADLLSPK